MNSQNAQVENAVKQIVELEKEAMHKKTQSTSKSVSMRVDSDAVNKILNIVKESIEE